MWYEASLGTSIVYPPVRLQEAKIPPEWDRLVAGPTLAVPSSVPLASRKVMWASLTTSLDWSQYVLLVWFTSPWIEMGCGEPEGEGDESAAPLPPHAPRMRIVVTATGHAMAGSRPLG